MSTQQIEIQQTNKLAVVKIADSQLTGEKLQEILVDLTVRINENNARYFVFDMSNVEFMGSSCLGALVRFLQDLDKVQGRIALAACKENVAFLFKVTMLESVFKIYDDLDEACTQITRDK